MSARRSIARLIALPAATVGFGVLAAGPALAHVSVSPTEGHAGDYMVATLSVPHGCEGSASTQLTIKIPAELNAVTPTRNALWDVKKNLVKLATPVKDAHGNEITERVDTVVYTAKSALPDGYRDTFELSFQVPDAVGKQLVFPTIQKCEKGETAWTEVPAEGAEEPAHPAPVVKVLAASGNSGHGAAKDSEDASDSDNDGASKGLAYTGIGVGALGLLTALAALAKGRRKA